MAMAGQALGRAQSEPNTLNGQPATAVDCTRLDSEVRSGVHDLRSDATDETGDVSLRKAKRWTHLKLPPRRRKAYADCHALHLYEEEIVMREVQRALRDGLTTVTSDQLIARHPDGFRPTYLAKTLKRLCNKQLLKREHARFFSRRMWMYSIRPMQEKRRAA